MRRTTTAWIAGALGAGLTASIVMAQQLPSSGASRAGASNAASLTPTNTPSLYGAAGTRGARYLMRNGLDYLNYQQFERALKFLREAEAKQKELTAPEILALKQGIEAARNGMRSGADAVASYALSEQSRRRPGFTAARPEIAVAQRTDPVGPSSRTKARPAPSAFPGMDEGPGDPIRLTSAQSTVDDSAARPSRTGSAPSRDASTAPAPRAAGDEIPTLTAPEIPTLTAVPVSPDTVGSSPVESPSSNPGLSAAAPRPVPQDPTITGASLATDGTATAAQSGAEPRVHGRFAELVPGPDPARDDRDGDERAGADPGPHEHGGPRSGIRRARPHGHAGDRIAGIGASGGRHPRGCGPYEPRDGGDGNDPPAATRRQQLGRG